MARLAGIFPLQPGEVPDEGGPEGGVGVAQKLRSDLLLKLAMTPASHEDWNLLLERYPGHVLEVSVYDRCLGDTPGRNALVWEVREY